MPSNKNSSPPGICGHEVPGKDLPEAKGFPGQGWWKVLGWAVGLPVGGFVGAGLAKLLFGDIQQGSIGALVGMGITYVVCQDVGNRIFVSRGISHYRQRAEREPDNADTLVQAGLWNLADSSSAERIATGRGLLRKALERSPGHRDATIALASSWLHDGTPQEAVELLEPWLTGREDLVGEGLAAQALKTLGRHEAATGTLPAGPGDTSRDAYAGRNRTVLEGAWQLTGGQQ